VEPSPGEVGGPLHIGLPPYRGRTDSDRGNLDAVAASRPGRLMGRDELENPSINRFLTRWRLLSRPWHTRIALFAHFASPHFGSLLARTCAEDAQRTPFGFVRLCPAGLPHCGRSQAGTTATGGRQAPGARMPGSPYSVGHHRSSYSSSSRDSEGDRPVEPPPGIGTRTCRRSQGRSHRSVAEPGPCAVPVQARRHCWSRAPGRCSMGEPRQTLYRFHLWLLHKAPASPLDPF
jgi:hypothetical protein